MQERLELWILVRGGFEGWLFGLGSELLRVETGYLLLWFLLMLVMDGPHFILLWFLEVHELHELCLDFLQSSEILLGLFGSLDLLLLDDWNIFLLSIPGLLENSFQSVLHFAWQIILLSMWGLGKVFAGRLRQLLVGIGCLFYLIKGRCSYHPLNLYFDVNYSN